MPWTGARLMFSRRTSSSTPLIACAARSAAPLSAGTGALYRPTTSWAQFATTTWMRWRWRSMPISSAPRS